ncbi:origin recognition complex subunit 1 isoform X2 [Hypanus sabinus]|uniref:origin recognition complex subunit 1 isoform X2 n=1 Tax=Hypanus sabinus TaxID=79690 RepID=UPI0028C4084E|nr:origin recognition complex subunit 1 isoform X2 [Hypanus sabinus]
MNKYTTRHSVRAKRKYTWKGRPVRVNRKLQDLVYEAIQIEYEGTSNIQCVKVEDFVLIMSDDEDRPYVAKLLKLFEEGAGQPPTKHALVQWFVRIEEIPKSKQKLLGREAHPNEIFLYEVADCDNLIGAETLLKQVKVCQIAPDDPFPPSTPGEDIFFVKLKWDGKSFNKLPRDLKKFSKKTQMEILSELLDEVDDNDEDGRPRKCHRAEKKHRVAKRKVDFSCISDNPQSPSKRLQSQSMKNIGLSPLVMTEKAMDNQLSPLKTSKMKQQHSSPPRINGENMDSCRPKRIKRQMENIGATPRPRRKSVSQRTLFYADNFQSDKDSEESSEGEFIPDNEKDSGSSSEDEEQDDDDSVSVRKSMRRTPKSKVKVPGSRTPRTPRTPKQPTPHIPRRTQLAKEPVSVLEEARARLHVSAVPESLPCREQEFQDIYNFVESKVIDGTGGCMYISGVPGTGKTATVHEVMRCLQQAVKQENLPSFQFIEINGMKLTDPHQCYVQILKLLTGQKATADHAATLLEKRFGTPAPKRESTVLLVDELDLLWTRKQNVMYNLFDWPTRKQAKLVVLAVANTMDLPERIMMNRVASRLGLTRMSFQPYTYKQLQQIISSRLNRLKAFENDAIQLVARKVAALSGDARRALDICRRAAEICQNSLSQKAASSLVGMPHVLQALDEMFSSPYITAIRNASVQEQIFMKAVLAEFQRLGLEEATFQQIYQQHIGLCRIEGLQPPTISETMLVCTRLGACRLLLVESSKNDLHLRVRMNVSHDDVMYALKEN